MPIVGFLLPLGWPQLRPTPDFLEMAFFPVPPTDRGFFKGLAFPSGAKILPMDVSI